MKHTSSSTAMVSSSPTVRVPICDHRPIRMQHFETQDHAYIELSNVNDKWTALLHISDLNVSTCKRNSKIRNE